MPRGHIALLIDKVSGQAARDWYAVATYAYDSLPPQEQAALPDAETLASAP